MRIVTAAVLLFALSFATVTAAADPAVDIPKMTREEALRYLESDRYAVDQTNLVVAIMNGKLELAEALLSAGVDVNDPELIHPALHLAATSCAGKRVERETILAMMEVLLAHGAKANVPGETELSALMVAAQQCDGSIVHRLVKAGADMKFRTSVGFTPLSMAFLVDNLSAAEALVDEGARLSAEAATKLLEGKDDPKYIALVKKARAK
jgi:ankyrin repeat protein